MRDLPPIGSRVRTTDGLVGIVQGHGWNAVMPGLEDQCLVRFHQRRYRWQARGYVELWVTADEIEEVLPDASDG